MANDIRVVAQIKAKADEVDAVRDALLACVEPTREEDGCLMYVLHRDTKDGSRFWFVEHWTSQAALDAHMKTAHFKTLAAAIDGKLAAPLAIDVLEPL